MPSARLANSNVAALAAAAHTPTINPASSGSKPIQKATNLRIWRIGSPCVCSLDGGGSVNPPQQLRVLVIMCSNAGSQFGEHASCIFARLQERCGCYQDDVRANVVGWPIGCNEPSRAVTRKLKQPIDDNHIHRIFFEQSDLMRVRRIDDWDERSRQAFDH